MSRIYSFPPIIDERARVLIAGTAPSVKSLEHGQFYGHPQNFFWRIMYGLFGEKEPGQIEYPAPDPVYENRIAFIQQHGVALWDIIGSCEREGSLDANIKEEIPNDFPGLLAQYPGIRCIAFNGGKAFDTFRKAFGKHPAFAHIAKLKLPSSSPIPTKHMRNLEDRIGAWRVIVPYTEES
ncbi:DNA-deoxyinosine glycosylase [Paenibacillus nanensis]|uniref:DNA-deoxyinosine glycosylase n=1 Tax=Paenibacillus nanensis TaxID=393251 RepID=UPI001F0C90AB|nr:DNA-deoxyinosine glycosylase [Paenibacillus nanensis]